MQDGGLEDIWLIDFGCSRHMTGNTRWFSSLTPVMHKEYITFGDNGGGRIKQSKEGTFVHQGKYTKDVLKKFDMADAKPLSTHMPTTTALDADEDREAVDQKEYRSMIGSLL